ncbi:hypothetical protein GCM10007386_09330 [Pseudoduganella dura]|nr:hypothetical protein GCM10007386_09330 [Pseudoduganella dura]
MLPPGLARRQPQEVLGTHAGLDSFDDPGYLLIGHKHFRPGLDEAEWTAADHIGWQLGLELTSPANEAYDGTEVLGGQSKKLFKSFGMTIVLMQRILETEFLAI